MAVSIMQTTISTKNLGNTDLKVPVDFTYIEKQIRKKSFGILSTVSPSGKPPSLLFIL
jgi:hypothetical protein